MQATGSKSKSPGDHLFSCADDWVYFCAIVALLWRGFDENLRVCFALKQWDSSGHQSRLLPTLKVSNQVGVFQP